MGAVDTLPPDQRAVLQLVLQRGRSYDDIATLLSIDRAAVRQRALGALDALGPQTRVPPERRALITDYLLGQLPARVREDTRGRLASSATERAWARVVASELSPLASSGLPEIPTEAPTEPEPSGPEPSRPEPAGAPSVGSPAPPSSPQAIGSPGPQTVRSAGQPSSRRGGALLLALGALIAVVVVVVLAAGGDDKPAKRTPSATSPPTSTAAATGTTPATSTTPTASTSAQVVRQINLASPTGANPKGIADLLKRGNTNAIAIVAQGMTPNTKHDAYAVWLYSPPSKARILGFVNPGVGANGRLSTAGALPPEASQYSRLLVTLETQSNPPGPGKIILQGALTIG